MQTNIIVFTAPKITHPPHSPIMHRLGVGTTAAAAAAAAALCCLPKLRTLNVVLLSRLACTR
jgi:hypothetical protein